MGSRHNYRLVIAYRGDHFVGFQQQQPGLRTVESTLLDAIRPYVPELPRLSVGGRTDKGVHALGQVVSFYSYTPLPLDELVDGIEREGEGGLAVREAREVPRAFHASFSAKSRRYVYRVKVGDLDVPSLDLPCLDAMLCALVGRRCFHAFARRTPPGQSTVRHLRQARALHDGPGRARIELVADRFLRRQVRVLVATALREMRRGADPDVLLELSQRGERALTAPPADADGLYLMSVEY